MPDDFKQFWRTLQDFLCIGAACMCFASAFIIFQYADSDTQLDGLYHANILIGVGALAFRSIRFWR